MRTIFLIDGFNLYHSVIDIGKEHSGCNVKWLDIYSLCKSYLPHIDKLATIESVYYFSALAHYKKDPDVIRRHKDYIKCLRDTGISVQLSRFKEKTTTDSQGNIKIRHEEKETDVAIASQLFEVLHTGICDCVVIVTGDTDFAPAVRTTKRLFPNKHIIFAFPYKRKNEELAILAPGSFKIPKRNYIKHQFPDPFELSDGTKISKPSSW